jgi:hypothetical protein
MDEEARMTAKITEVRICELVHDVIGGILKISPWILCFSLKGSCLNLLVL